MLVRRLSTPVPIVSHEAGVPRPANSHTRTATTRLSMTSTVPVELNRPCCQRGVNRPGLRSCGRDREHETRAELGCWLQVQVPHPIQPAHIQHIVHGAHGRAPDGT
jgi:hypothetical protein